MSYDKQHTYDQLTNCCTKCGQRESYLVDQSPECVGGDDSNIVAISHLVLGRKVRHLADRMLEAAIAAAP